MTKAAVLVVAVAGSAFGQRNLGPVGHGFGNVVFPGTGIPQQPSGHIPNLGATIRGVYPQNPFPQQQVPYRRAQQAVVLPVPVYVGGYGYGYAPPAPEPQPITIMNAPQVGAPSVIINQHYTPDRAQPVMHEYTNGNPGGELNTYQAPVPSHPEPVKPAPAPAAASRANDDTPTVYLIALKDGTVYSAYAYWLEADTLHYITTKHSHNRATLSLVDESLSLQLNRERSVDFKLKGR